MTPTEEIITKIQKGETLNTWEMEHLYSKLKNDHDKRLLATLTLRLITGEGW